MPALIETLPEDSVAELRRFASTAEDVTWPATVARVRGWRVANAAYQAAQRAHGQEEMEALLRSAGLTPPVDPDRLTDVLLAATELFLHTEVTDSAVVLEEGTLHIEVSRCPLFEHFSDPHWRGLTACGCFARRQGWQDALGVAIDADVLQNRKWGDPVCEIVVYPPGHSRT